MKVECAFQINLFYKLLETKLIQFIYSQVNFGTLNLDYTIYFFFLALFNKIIWSLDQKIP